MGKKMVLVAFLVLLSSSLTCGEKPNEPGDRGKASRPPGSSASEMGAGLRFKTFSYLDRQGTGIEAFRMLIPSDWQFEGGIKWVLDNPGMPASASFRVWNPTGTEEFEVFPTQPFFWTNNQMILSMFPIGSRYFGNEVRPPANPVEAIKEIVIPRFRHNVSGLRIVNEQPLPDLARAVGAGTPPQPGLSVSADGAKIRVEYNQQGKTMEEELYTVVQSMAIPIQTMAGVVTNINWYVDYIFSFKAEKGKLDGNAKTFQAIAYSFALSPKWFAKYNQVVEYLIQRQIQQIHSVGQLSKIISQTSNEISEMSMKSYYERQAVNDKIADNFSQYIRGVDKYYNPIEEKNVELPVGYDNVWANSLGEYVLSESPSFNPNIGSNLNWQRIKKR
ncbi:MAG: hypothetical protein SWQ30_05570 [Thermodesulfobacteriota bacterium]|nr:hypothetical protein [Thermodesulfobacteriota bacterium]